MDFPKFSTLEVLSYPGWFRILLNRPEKHNAIHLEMVKELHQLMDILESQYPFHLLVFAGGGEKSFVAGADIYELKERKAKDALLAINAKLMNRIFNFPFPTIAEIQGYCFGGGMELALACDIRIAAKEARFGQPEVGFNILAGAGGTWRLPAIIGRGNGRDLLFTGRKISAQKAFELGLIQYLVEKKELSQKVEEVVQQILSQGKEALSLTKRILNLEERPYQWEAVNFAQAYLFDSEEKEKRMAAFLHKNLNKKRENRNED